MIRFAIWLFVPLLSLAAYLSFHQWRNGAGNFELVMSVIFVVEALVAVTGPFLD